ncbi:F-box protein At5g49610-like [Salvia hispanica]|uniref:F-box protein At5g49610-like n=1 Tax=Salvia hispanica TaxID=49212 RepID=UPI0020099D58|nr:F-box protein At5g49610-like [Salvia hispanica]
MTNVLMKEGLFTNLPEDITRDILRRLPIRSIARCKCVCKSWRQFATSKSGLVFANEDTGFTFCDEVFQPLCQFRLPLCRGYSYRYVIGSADGFILVCAAGKNICEILCLCNPITREYIELPALPGAYVFNYVYGFGVSKLSGQYKILFSSHRSCFVYTLGKIEYWRRISVAPGNPCMHRDKAVFFNGNLHWLTSDSSNLFVCCLDLETELFTRYSIPSRDYGSHGYDTYIGTRYYLYVLEGRLCLSKYISPHGIVIWRMENYGDENSWIKEYTLENFCGHFYPLVSLNGDLIFASIIRHDRQLLVYSKNTEPLVTYRRYPYSRLYSSVNIYTPSFISLETMGIHNVQILKNNVGVALVKVPEMIGDLKEKNWLAAGVSTIATVFVAAGWLAVGFSTIATCTNNDSSAFSILY